MRLVINTKDETFKFQLILTASALMHLTFLIIFAFFRMYMMMSFNIFSVALYAVGAIQCINRSIGKHSLAWIVVIYAEIVLHATLCTLIQGIEVCYFLYLMLTIPIAGYCLFFAVDKKKFNKITLIFTAITLVMLLFCIVFVECFGTVYELSGMHRLSESEIIIERNVNIGFAVITLFGFTFLFHLEIMALLNKLRESNKRLEYTAQHDALTGLANRNLLWTYLEKLFKSEERYCVIMGDLDDFKRINDTYGHDAGDKVLKSVAEILINNTKSEDIACRWGGEEMLLIMRGSKESCFPVVEKIKKEINALEIKSEGRKVKVSMTFGFVDCEEAGKKSGEKSGTNLHIYMDNLISMADKKLYTGKNSGKNVIVA